MAWNPVLIEQSDLETRVGDLTLWTQADGADSDAAVNAAIAQCGALITSKLTRYLPELFVTTIGVYSDMPFADWLLEQGYSYTDLDSALDKIVNPEVLKPWAVAYTLKLLSERMIAKFQVIGDQTIRVMVDQRDYWGKEAVRLEKECTALLQLDFHGNGQVTDFGRTRTHKVWLRG